MGDVLTSLLFERPWLLLLVLVGLEFTLIVLWSRWRSAKLSRLIWTVLAAIPILLVLGHLVVTQREQIIALCHQLASAVEAGDMAAIEERLAADFEAAGLGGADLVNRVEQTLTRHHVIKPRLRRFAVTFPTDGVGEVTFSALCRVESSEGYFDRLPSRWRLTLRQDGDTWEVTTIETLPVPPLHARSLHELFR